VRDEQAVVHQMNIRFDAAEAVLQRVEQRPRVEIIVMRVRAREASRFCCIRGER
jgi:hypothetical protein